MADDHEVDLDAIVDMLVAAGHAPDGARCQMGRALAMGGVDADSETVLAGLPDADAP